MPETPKTPEDIAAEEAAAAEAAKKPVDEAALSLFVQRQIDGPDSAAIPEAEVQKPDPDPDPDPDKPKPKPAEKKPAAPAAPAAAPTPRPKPPTHEQLVSAAAEGAARVITERQASAPAAAATDKPTLSASDQRKVAVLTEMEKLFPDKYKGIVGKFQQGTEALSAYKAKWQSENVGESFDPEDPDHEDFLSQHNVNWDDEDYQEALIEKRAGERIASMKEEFDKRFDTLDKKQRSEEQKEVVASIANTSSDLFLKELAGAPESPFAEAKLVGEDGSRDKEAVESLDPIAQAVVVEHYGDKVVKPLTSKLYKLFNDMEVFQPDKDMDHRWLSDFLAEKEAQLSALPQEKQMNAAGQSFLPQSKFSELPASQRAAHWTIGFDEANILMTRHFADVAVSEYKSEQEKFVRYGGKAPTAASGSPAEQKKTPMQEVIEDRLGGKPSSPSSGMLPKMASKSSDTQDEAKTPHSAFMGRFLGSS